MRRAVLWAGVIVGLVSLVATAFEVQGEEPKVIRMEILGVSETAYLLSGGGGNTLAVVDYDGGGVVVIDTKPPGWGQPILDALSYVTTLPVTTIINTHAHEAQVGANSEFPDVVEIIAHENTKASMARMEMFQGENAKYLPTRTFTDTLSLLEGDDRIDLYHFGAGHTGGDTVVIFPEKTLVYMSGLFESSAVPLIDTSSGGSGVAYPDTLARAVAEVTRLTGPVSGGVQYGGGLVTGGMVARNTYTDGLLPVPGRETFAWDILAEYADFTRDFVAAVEEAFEVGKSVDEAVSGLELPGQYRDYGMDNARATIEVIYDELAR